MKRILIISLLFFISASFSYGISVELVPTNTSVKMGDEFKLDLIVKNAPSDTKCNGYENKIVFDKNFLNLKNIQLSSVSDSAALKNTVINNSDGWGYISLAWFSNEPYGNFTIATLTFKTLNEGSTNISLDEVAVSNTDGTKYSNVIVKNSTVYIQPLNQTYALITLENFEVNKNINMIISIYGAKYPIKNISGSIDLKNISIIGTPSQKDLFFNSFYYKIDDKKNNISFMATPIKEDENKSIFDFLSIPITVNNTYYTILSNISINGIPISNISIIEKKPAINTNTSTTSFRGLGFYCGGYVNNTNLVYGSSKDIYLKGINIDKNIKNISGCIFINSSLFNVYDYSIPTYSKIYDIINYKNIYLNGSYLYYNISLKNETNGTFTILMFKITPKVNNNESSIIYCKNTTIYSNNTLLTLPTKNLTVNIIEKSKNSPPYCTVGISIMDSIKVQYHAFVFDEDDDNLKYYWNFGDGTNSTDKDPIHTYRKEGNYLIKFIVRDSLNASDEATSVITIKKYSPLNYSILNKNNSEKILNISVVNPLPWDVNGYLYIYGINLANMSNKYHSFYLKKNDSLNIIIPLNITDGTIKWSLEYYPYIRGKFNKKVQLNKYSWDYSYRIPKSNGKTASINSVRNITKIMHISKIVDLNNTKIVFKINKNKKYKNMVINKSIVLNYPDEKGIIYYCIVAIIGFLIGFILLGRF